MDFSKDEMIMMMLYSPGNRPGLISTLEDMKGQLTGDDAELSVLVDSILPKLNAMTDEEFNGMSICPDI
ncbi:MAG: transposon-transfer assisting family protein [Lachnospiraceae bacterium]|nr:transposon-transfer assisting family protein [Lachnospiraceae bacterium]MDO4515446.1 transposon-transfer assisting family protein [Lachnospiraceae bacterium]